METKYTCPPPWVIGKIKKILLWLQVKIKKIGHFSLEESKFDIFALVIG